MLRDLLTAHWPAYVAKFGRLIPAEQRAAVDAELQMNLERLIETVYPFHGLAQTALATTAASG